jgi:hypothetical protein
MNLLGRVFCVALTPFDANKTSSLTFLSLGSKTRLQGSYLGIGSTRAACQASNGEDHRTVSATTPLFAAFCRKTTRA